MVDLSSIDDVFYALIFLVAVLAASLILSWIDAPVSWYLIAGLVSLVATMLLRKVL